MVRARRAGARGPRVEAASRRRAGAALALTAALFTAACGGSSGPVTAADTSEQRAADGAVARGAVLRSGDVPTGFKPRAHRSAVPQLSDAAEQGLLHCAHLPPVFVESGDDEPDADSPDFISGRFARGPAQLVESNVLLARSSEDLRTPMTRVVANSAARCFSPYFRAGFEQGLGHRPSVTMTNFAVRPLDVGRIGDQAVAFQGAVTMNTSGGPVQQDLDLYFVRSGRALVTVRAAGYNEPFDQRLAENLLSTIVSRLGSAR